MTTTIEPEVMVNGETWYSFSVEYQVGDKTMRFYIYAKSFDHADELLEALKCTATIAGQSVLTIPADDDAEALMSADRVLN